MDNLKKPVNLRSLRKTKQASPKKKKAPSSGIDRVYGGGSEEKIRKDLSEISVPKQGRNFDFSFFMKIFYLFALLLLIFGVYFFYNGAKKPKEQKTFCQDKWYRVELVDHSVYYALICDLKSDPLLLKEVYYDYDQINKDASPDKKTKSLRLVKRGKESYGPDGTMQIIRSQVLFFEPLREDSKVLTAIKSYEKD